MESSACQVKGCKANKKVAKSLAHDDSRATHKDNNNVNCSDDENNDDTIKKNNNNNTKKPLHSKNSTTNHNSSTLINNNNNNNNAINNKNLALSAAQHNKFGSSSIKMATSDLSYNHVVSGSNKTATNHDQNHSSSSNNNRLLSSYKTATASLPYNKVVSSGKTVLDDCTYDKILAEIKTSLPLMTTVSLTSSSSPSLSSSSSSNSLPTSTSTTTNATTGSTTTTLTSANKTAPTTTTTNNVLSYNQVVINAKEATSSYLGSYNNNNNNTSNNNRSYISYNKVVSGTDGILVKSSSNSSISSGPTQDLSVPSLNGNCKSSDAPKLQQQRQQSQQPQQSQLTLRQQQQHQQHQQQANRLKSAELEQRRAVLSYEQVCRLNDVMNEVVSIHGRGNFPTLEVRLRDLVTVVRAKLEEDPSSGGAGMRVRDIRLNGGAASHVLATESQPYNDLDLIFGVELGSGRNYDKIKAAVLSSLFDLLPEGVSRKRITACSLKEAYVSKMVKVNNDGDRWSLISLGNSRGHRNVELKFVDTMRRQFEFSVDSFQILLDSLLQFYAGDGNSSSSTTATNSSAPTTPATTGTGEETTAVDDIEISELNHPEVLGESVYGDFHEALYHLQKKLISTRHPEEIRGGGLLKYCNLLVKLYKPAQPDYIKTLERYMCSRFFIDFPDIGQQRAKLENYLWNHFVGPEEEALKYQYLMLLHSVVEESTVCLMGHERRQTLALIESLAYQVLCQGHQLRLTTSAAAGHHQHHHHHHHHHQVASAPPPAGPPPTYVYANGYYYTPVIPTACYTCTCSSWMACSS